MSFIKTLFNNFCKIYELIEVTDSTGGKQTTLSAIAVRVPCRIRSLRGTEDFDLLGRLGVEATKKVYMSPRPVVEKNVIEVSGIQYDIEYVDNKHEMSHHLEIWVKERT